MTILHSTANATHQPRNTEAESNPEPQLESLKKRSHTMIPFAYLFDTYAEPAANYVMTVGHFFGY